MNKPEPSYAPMYAASYPDLAKLVRTHGYALACHGSLQRDFDLVAIPWTEDAAEPQVVVDDICTKFAFRQIGEPGAKPHGRRAWSISIGHGWCALDLSFMPRSPQ